MSCATGLFFSDLSMILRGRYLNLENNKLTSLDGVAFGNLQ